MIAALFVETNGIYFGLPNVDPWDKTRDARTYAGPHPVVAHPPCERWGRYWGGAPATWPRKIKGDDGGCFAAALAAVRTFGGVIEHPEASYAWDHFGLNKPPKDGRWIVADFVGGWTCCVEQGHYGHRARKATWLSTPTALSCRPSSGDRAASANVWKTASTRKRNAHAPSRPAFASAFRNGNAQQRRPSFAIC